MLDVTGKIASYIIAIFLFFYVPLTIFAQKNDMVVQHYVETSAEEFIDIARTNGYISRSEYNSLITKLDATGNIYDIKINHYSKRSNTLNSDENFEATYEVMDKQDILLGMQNSDPSYGSEKYVMRKGDFIRIEIKNINPTMATKLMSIAYGRGSEGGQIMCSFGGYVGYDN